ncbi:hypothetical protein U9M48_007399 [Paspalum notatum var. saurae]|uniref:DUF1618 domain-containing protein n=1 Tax=Paspalum notatum var. saurae TaxID=547442 RepID=A0AAQ3Q001_PASNO
MPVAVRRRSSSSFPNLQLLLLPPRLSRASTISMDPCWAVLDRSVRLVASTGEKTTGGGSVWDIVVDGVDGNAGEEEEPVGLVGWVREGSVRLAPDLAAPPMISTLSLHLPATPLQIAIQLHSVTVMCADKNLLVLFTGPDSFSYASSGHYLIYDADADTLAVAPPINWREVRDIFSHVPAIVRRGQGNNDFVLALVVRSMFTREHWLLLWSPGQDRWGWTQKEAKIPAEVLQYAFFTDVSFAFQGSWACWADLYFGMLTFNVLSDDQLQFVPLPQAYVMEHPPMPRGRPDMHSTIGCVNGVIKFLTMDGYNDCPGDMVQLNCWSLQAPNLGRWMIDDDNRLFMAELWVDKTYLKIPVTPRELPMCPVLSLKEPSMFFFFLSDVDDEDGNFMVKGEYVFSLNMQSRKVQSWSKCPPGRSLEFIPRLIATELCAYPPRMHDQEIDTQKQAKDIVRGNVTRVKREGAEH